VTLGVLAVVAAVACPAGHACVTLSGQVRTGERVATGFGPGLTFALEPIEHGWEIVIRDDRPNENIARLTPPWHFVPNPRFVEGWHFRNVENTGPNDGSVNAPQAERDFIYSVDVGRSISYPPTSEQVAAVQAWGEGRLLIKSYELDAIKAGSRAKMTHMQYEVLLTWPSTLKRSGSGR